MQRFNTSAGIKTLNLEKFGYFWPDTFQTLLAHLKHSVKYFAKIYSSETCWKIQFDSMS